MLWINIFRLFLSSVCSLTRRDRKVIDFTWSRVKNMIPNLPILGNYLELSGIMVNKGRIHKELRYFLMYSSKLIKSDNDMMIEIGENGKL